MAIGCFDLEALKKDRDQLWAEAAELEAKGESIRLSPDLWAEATREQELRQLGVPFLDTLAERLGSLKGKILVNDVMRLLDISLDKRTPVYDRYVGEAMGLLGWERKKLRHEGHNAYTYVNTAIEDAEWIRVTNDKENRPVAQLHSKREANVGDKDFPF